MNTPKRACALIRVSSEEQAKEGFGLEFQEKDIRAFCQQRNLELIETFRDEGFSGATADRPGFQEMMRWARGKKFDVLVVWKLDRLFRNAGLTLQTVEELYSLGLEFHSVQESFTHDSNGKFLLTIFAAGAEKERADILSRMYSGRMTSARNGTWINGGVAPFGYNYTKGAKRLVVNPDEAEVVKSIFNCYVKEGLSIYKIQERLNSLKTPTKYDNLGRHKPSESIGWWRARTIGRILSNEVYTGKYTFRKFKRIANIHSEDNMRPKDEWITVDTPKIISQELFERVQEQFKKNIVNSPRRTIKLYLLGKLLICGHDGRRMQATTVRRGNKTYKLYYCSAVRKYYSPHKCSSRMVSEERVTPPVWDALYELLTDPKNFLASLEDYRDSKTRQKETLEQRQLGEAKRKKLVNERDKLANLYLEEAISEELFRKRNDAIKSKLSLLDSEQKRIEQLLINQKERNLRDESLVALSQQFADNLKAPSPEIKREILKTFVSQVVVTGEDVDLEVSLPYTGIIDGHPTVRLADKVNSIDGQATSGLSGKTFSIWTKVKLVAPTRVNTNRELGRAFARE